MRSDLEKFADQKKVIVNRVAIYVSPLKQKEMECLIVQDECSLVEL